MLLRPPTHPPTRREVTSRTPVLATAAAPRKSGPRRLRRPVPAPPAAAATAGPAAPAAPAPPPPLAPSSASPVDEDGLPMPALHQQTLATSFTLGGIGLHSGEYAIVRVRPAHAGDGRYFVAVPRGTNAARYDPHPHLADAKPTPMGGGGGEDGGGGGGGHLPADAAAFTAYLRAVDGGFEGDFPTWAAANPPPAPAPPAPVPAPPPLALETPVPRSGPGAGEVDAVAANASPCPAGRSTQLSSSAAKGAPAFTGVEALLSALEGMGVGNARIEVEPGSAAAGVVVRAPPPGGDDAPPSSLELPALDGSALGWAVEVARAGVVVAPPRPGQGGAPPPPKTVPTCRRALTETGPDGAFASFIPAPRPSLSVGVGAPPETPAIGRQWCSWAPSPECGHYRWVLSPARDWVASARELVALRSEVGAYKAGTVGTTLVGAGETWLDPGRVRFPGDEPARHDAADAVGDLSLLASGGGLGLPLGHFVSWNATPALRLALVKALAAEAEAVEVVEAARAALGGGE